MANFEALDFKGSGVSQSKKESGLSEYASSLFDPALTWKDVDWLKSVTKLPLIVKGILSGKALCSIPAQNHLDYNVLNFKTSQQPSAYIDHMIAISNII